MRGETLEQVSCDRVQVSREDRFLDLSPTADEGVFFTSTLLWSAVCSRAGFKVRSPLLLNTTVVLSYYDTVVVLIYQIGVTNRHSQTHSHTHKKQQHIRDTHTHASNTLVSDGRSTPGVVDITQQVLVHARMARKPTNQATRFCLRQKQKKSQNLISTTIIIECVEQHPTCTSAFDMPSTPECFPLTSSSISMVSTTDRVSSLSRRLPDPRRPRPWVAMAKP